MPTEITTPVGRIVWGHPTKSRTKTDQRTKQPILKDGQPVQQWAFGVAWDKATFQQYIWPALAAEAQAGYPGGTPPQFAFKYVDGDTLDREGKPYNLREGYAGNIVLSISSEFRAPPIFKFVNGSYQQLQPDAVKCGDYVSVGLNLKVNVPTDRTHTPGLYVNPTAVEFVAYGTEIISAATADPNAIFKGQQHQLPPGASAVPIGAPAGAATMPGMGAQAPMMGGQPGYPPQQPMAAPQPAYAPQPGYPPPVAAQAPVGGQPGYMPPPAPDFVQNAGMQQPAPGYAPQPGYPPPVAAPAMQPGGQPGMAPPPMMAPGYPPQQPGMMPPR